MVLGLLGIWGLSELAKGLDGYGQLEETSYGADGSEIDPLGPGVTGRYEDGLEVTVSQPRLESDMVTYSFTVTYKNGSDRTFSPGDGRVGESGSSYEPAPLDVRAGRPGDDYGPVDGSRISWLNDQEVDAKLLPELGEDESVTVPMYVTGSRRGMPITVEVTPPDPGYRESAYWALTLD